MPLRSAAQAADDGPSAVNEQMSNSAQIYAENGDEGDLSDQQLGTQCYELKVLWLMKLNK